MSQANSENLKVPEDIHLALEELVKLDRQLHVYFQLPGSYPYPGDIPTDVYEAKCEALYDLDCSDAACVLIQAARTQFGVYAYLRSEIRF